MGGYAQAISAQVYSGPQKQPLRVAAADGAITPNAGSVAITKGSAAAMTLALPIATTDDGVELEIFCTTAFAHTVTTPATGLNGSLHIATFAAAAGNGVKLIAYQGSWYVRGNLGITLS